MPYHGAFGVWVYGGFSVVNGKDEKVRLENDINADIYLKIGQTIIRDGQFQKDDTGNWYTTKNTEALTEFLKGTDGYIEDYFDWDHGGKTMVAQYKLKDFI